MGSALLAPAAQAGWTRPFVLVKPGTVDFLPTILELMGGKTPASVEGASLTPFFTSKDAATAVSYAETLYPKINMGWVELRAIRTNRWKYIRAPRPELYDLSDDAGETKNVLARRARRC